MTSESTQPSVISRAAALDRPEILQILFHPRKAPIVSDGSRADEIAVETPDNAVIGCRLHLDARESPVILFFHGNGEIAHDYDTIGPIYLSSGINFIVADYRGYGISTGSPTVSNLFADAYTVLAHIRNTLDEKGYKGPLWIMGRSLGSAPAIELAAGKGGIVDGLIVESGFSEVKDLLERIGILPRDMTGEPDAFFSSADTIRRFNGPVLIIHAEHDQIIPVDHGRKLHDSAPGPVKKLKIIPGADHNNIFAVAGMNYFETIRKFMAG